MTEIAPGVKVRFHWENMFGNYYTGEGVVVKEKKGLWAVEPDYSTVDTDLRVSLDAEIERRKTEPPGTHHDLFRTSELEVIE